jgi:hypothetical protein
MDNVTPRPLYPRERNPVSAVQEAGWAPGPVWTGDENLAPPPLGFDPWNVQSAASCYTGPRILRSTDYTVNFTANFQVGLGNWYIFEQRNLCPYREYKQRPAGRMLAVNLRHYVREASSRLRDLRGTNYIPQL